MLIQINMATCTLCVKHPTTWKCKLIVHNKCTLQYIIFNNYMHKKEGRNVDPIHHCSSTQQKHITLSTVLLHYYMVSRLVI